MRYKVTRKFENHFLYGSYLGIWGLREVLPGFNPYRHTTIRNGISPNFNDTFHTLTDICGKKSAIFTRIHIFGILGPEPLWSEFDNLRLEMA